MVSAKELIDRIATLEERADRQAAAIKKLREYRDDLRDRLASLESAIPSTAPAPLVAAPGVYVPSPLCVVCGQDKGGRSALTCKTCSDKRTAALAVGGAAAATIKTDTCANCGGHFAPQSRYLCIPCSRSFKVWKASR